MFNIATELYCDATIFVFWIFIVYFPKKNGNWNMAQGCRLSPILDFGRSGSKQALGLLSLFLSLLLLLLEQ